jgi:tripartite-type tricarboxylate transporter receptor subunit TctC
MLPVAQPRTASRAVLRWRAHDWISRSDALDQLPPASACGPVKATRSRAALVAAVALCAWPTAGSAQPAPAWPAKPVRTIVAFAPGGANDVVVRLVGGKLSELWSQPVVVENRPGAGATLGMELVARAAPDGYTLGAGNQSSLVIGPLLHPKVAYNPLKDLTLIGSTALTAYVVAVNPGVPVKTVADLLRLARAKPGFLSYGTAGTGTISHIATEMLLGATGTRIVHVPYKGAGPYLHALITGEIDVALVALPAVESFVRSGRLRLIAAAGAQRAAAAPELPTLIESGVKIPSVEGRYGLVGPAAMPRELVARINASIGQALAAPDLRKRLIAGGFEPLTDTPEQYAASVRLEIETFSRIIREHGIRPES